MKAVESEVSQRGVAETSIPRIRPELSGIRGGGMNLRQPSARLGTLRFFSFCVCGPLRAKRAETDHRQSLPRNIPALLRRCGANLLHCRSPFSLCLEHVDTWKRTASRRRPAFSSHLVTTASTHCCLRESN